jgi:hypothetical protein
MKTKQIQINGGQERDEAEKNTGKADVVMENQKILARLLVVIPDHPVSYNSLLSSPSPRLLSCYRSDSLSCLVMLRFNNSISSLFLIYVFIKYVLSLVFTLRQDPSSPRYETADVWNMEEPKEWGASRGVYCIST